jgi:hypothetical protein
MTRGAPPLRDERRWGSRAGQSRSDALTGIIGAAGMDGLDDFGVVDALQVDRGDAEVAVAELALDHDQRHTFTRHFDGVGVPELVWREAPADTGCESRPAKLCSGRCARPRSTACGPVDDAEERPDGKLDSQLEPRLQLLPAPCVHSDFTAVSALAATDE